MALACKHREGVTASMQRLSHWAMQAASVMSIAIRIVIIVHRFRSLCHKAGASDEEKNAGRESYSCIIMYWFVSDWILTSCQAHRETSGRSNS